MKASDILKHVDHTLLSPTATWPQIEELCEEALIYHTASICIPPSYVARVREAFGPALNICTVIGFPLGADTTEAKVWASKQAVKNGAQEVDAVVNLGDVKNGDFDKITEEIASLKKAVGKHILKIIIETCYLEDEEKIALCHAVTDGGADYIKTSTGFGSAGATHSDVVLMRRNVGPDVKVKAAGGIRTISDMKQYLEEGCDRLGCSAAVRLLKDKTDEEI